MSDDETHDNKPVKRWLPLEANPEVSYFPAEKLYNY